MMKRFLLSVCFIVLSNALIGQNLSSIVRQNPDRSQEHLFYSSSSSMLNPRARVYYLQSVSKQDTVCSHNYFLNLKIYTDVPSSWYSSDDLYTGDYAFGSCVTDQGDTVLVCVNKDLSIRFTFPDNTTHARPFLNGISLVSRSPRWAMHAAESRYGAVSMDGTVLFEPTHNAIFLSKDKAVAIDETGITGKMWNKYLLTVMNNRGLKETTIVYYYPAKYDSYFLGAGNDFWFDVNSLDSSDYSEFFVYDSLTEDIYSALVNLAQLDFISAHNHLKQALHSDDPLIRKCARKNLKTINTLFKN